ncbi:hypothetical protein [Shivajiella indica]|uniref:Lipoprotein n=1 Tax=Shivajiella indica TaxID=872115 RepID=A0ABW5BFH0_9BACT
MKNIFTSLILLGILLFSISCNSNILEKKAKADAESFLNNVDYPQALMRHPMVEPEDIPKALADQNKLRNLENFKNSISEICGNSRDFRLVETYRKIGDDGEKFIALEYSFCDEIIVIFGYKLIGNGVKLYSIWPMSKEDRPKDLFGKEQSW